MCVLINKVLPIFNVIHICIAPIYLFWSDLIHYNLYICKKFTSMMCVYRIQREMKYGYAPPVEDKMMVVP